MRKFFLPLGVFSAFFCSLFLFQNCDSKTSSASAVPSSTTSSLGSTSSTAVQTAVSGTSITNENSGKCLGDDHSGSAGVGIIQWPCDGASYQAYTFNPIGNGFFTITPSNNQLCLDYTGGDQTGIQVIQNTCATTAPGNLRQQWGLQLNPDGSYLLKTAGGIGCLSVENSSIENAAHLVTLPCVGAANQKFKFSKFSPVTPLPTQGVHPIEPPLAGATAGTWIAKTINGLPYRLLLPYNYSETNSYPLVMTLHGMGAETPDGQLTPAYNLFTQMMNYPKYRSAYPAFVLAPMCMKSSKTNNFGGYPTPNQTCEDNAIAAVRDVMANYSVDASRIYLVGGSMGALGTWDIILNRNADHLFAAARPAAGSVLHGITFYQAAQYLKNFPLLSTHGTADTSVSPAWDEAFYSAMVSIGGQEIFHELPGATHDQAMYEADTNPANYAWLFSQSRQ